MSALPVPGERKEMSEEIWQYRYRHKNPKAVWSEWGEYSAFASSDGDYMEEKRRLYLASDIQAVQFALEEARAALAQRKGE